MTSTLEELETGIAKETCVANDFSLLSSKKDTQLTVSIRGDNDFEPWQFKKIFFVCMQSNIM